MTVSPLIAHVAGIPAEELLLPLLSTGGAVIVALRARLATTWRRLR